MSDVTVERVQFSGPTASLVGTLNRPATQRGTVVVVTGPMTSVKEQASGAYAKALADRGFISLVFDHRFFGESGGEPRQLESPPRKIEDIRSAIDFLGKSFPSERICALGVCAGAGYMSAAVAHDPRVSAFAGVAGVYHDSDALRVSMGPAYPAAMESALAARRSRKATGHIAYVPAVGLNDPNVAMPLDEAYAYYGTSRGAVPNYVNLFAIESRIDTLPFDAQKVAAQIQAPTMIVHSERALAPEWARAFYARLRATKSDHWLQSQGQIDFYDDQSLIGRAADLVARHFNLAY